MDSAVNTNDGSNLRGLFSNTFNKEKKKEKESMPLWADENEDVRHFIKTHVNSDDIYDVSKKLVRIEYPGNVQNIGKAIETLGGLDGIQQAVLSKGHNKLQLRFHPDSPYNKSAVAERNSHAGILLKIRQRSEIDSTYSYNFKVVGVTTINFQFNRACDYQFLPLVVSGGEEEHEHSKATNLFEKILPDKLPSLEYLQCEESKRMIHVAVPAVFSRFETSLNTLFLNAGEKFNSSLRPEMTKFIESSYENGQNRKKRTKTPFRRISIFVDLSKPDTAVIPERPLLENVEQTIHERGLQAEYQQIKKLFNERPAWTKAGVMHRCTGLSFEHSLVLLPAVAYFCVKGPWRMTWIRFGYNPLTDYNSRIYQTLDYRIRTAEGTQLKVNPKRSYSSKTVFYLGPSDVQRISLKENMQIRKDVDENTYTLRTNTIPPARQMFYQYCDILLPEVQDMLNRLPKSLAQSSSVQHCADGKCGWLPSNFTEQCREIVNEYILRNVQEELLKDLEKEKEMRQEKLKRGSTTAACCSRDLEDVKYHQKESTVLDTIIVLPDDDPILDADGMHQVNANTLIANALPEQLPNEEEQEIKEIEHSDDDPESEMEIDEEAAMEINQIIYDNDDDVTEITNYLKKHL